MNRYQPSTPRVTFGIVAAAMTVITFALLVIVPTTMDSMSDELGTVATSTVAAPAKAEVALIPTPAVVAPSWKQPPQNREHSSQRAPRL